MKISVIRNIKQIKKPYEKFIERCKDARFFHTYFWLAFLEKNFDEARYVVAEDKNEIVGMLPLFKENKEFVSLPYSAEGGPIALKKDKTTIRKLILKTLEEIKNVEAISINNVTKEKAEILEKEGLIIFPNYVFPVLGLSTLEDFWNKTLNDSKARKAVKKPLNKAGKVELIIKEVKTEEDIKEYFKIEKANMQRNMAEYKPLSFWKSLFKTIPEENRKFLLVKYGKEVIAGRISLFFKNDKTIQNYRNVSLKKYQNLYPNEFMQYYIIKWAIGNNYKYINYGANSLKKDGTYLFKRKFANKDLILWSAVYPLTNQSKKEIEKLAQQKYKDYREFCELK